MEVHYKIPENGGGGGGGGGDRGPDLDLDRIHIVNNSLQPFLPMKAKNRQKDHHHQHHREHSSSTGRMTRTLRFGFVALMVFVAFLGLILSLAGLVVWSSLDERLAALNGEVRQVHANQALRTNGTLKEMGGRLEALGDSVASLKASEMSTRAGKQSKLDEVQVLTDRLGALNRQVLRMAEDAEETRQKLADGAERVGGLEETLLRKNNQSAVFVAVRLQAINETLQDLSDGLRTRMEATAMKLTDQIRNINSRLTATNDRLAEAVRNVTATRRIAEVIPCDGYRVYKSHSKQGSLVLGNYNNNEHRSGTWAVPAGRRVHLNFGSFRTTGDRDALLLLDPSTGGVIRRLSGTPPARERDIIAPGSQVDYIWHTDRSDGAEGWSVTVSCSPYE